MLKVIKINRINNDLISLKHSFDEELYNGIKKIPGIQWNNEERQWELQFNEETITLIKNSFKNTRVIFSDYYYLYELEKDLRLRNYSRQTIKIYLSNNLRFLRFSRKKPEEVSSNDIKNFLLHLIDHKKFSAASLDSMINSLKYYYGRILGRSFVYEIKRPKKEKKLPIVLNKEELALIINSIKNIKHKTLVIIIYSSGLRVSEASKLKIMDIDSGRKVIKLTEAKGKKDRYTLLSDTALESLRDYFRIYKPKYWLFEGQQKSRHITVRTIQKIFQEICKKVKLRKKATIHTLRHSFATHLLDSGVDIRYIQEILGHKSSKTTEIYTHVSTNKLVSLKNPIDDIPINKSSKKNLRFY